MPVTPNYAASRYDIFVALLRAELTDLEYAAFAAVAYDGLTESEAALELTRDLDTPISRTKLHRLKQTATARIRQALHNA